ncbi:MAG: lipopolysaccharide biosynthesis protein [Elusimicrobiales bacterium]
MKGSAIAFAGNGLIYALAFVFQLLLVRLLGAGGYGVWGFALTLAVTVAQFSVLGLGYGCIYFSSARNAGAAGLAPAGAARLTFLSALFVSCAASLLLLPAAKFWIAPAYKLPGLEPLLYIFAAAVPLSALVLAMEYAFRSRHDASAAFKMKLSAEGLKLILIPAALLLFAADARVAAAALVAALAVSAVYGAYMTDKLVFPLRPLFKGSGWPAAAAPLALYSLPFFLHEVLMTLRDKADTFIIGYFSSAEYLGMYKGACVLAALISFVPNSVSYLLFPLINNISGPEHREELAAFGRRTIKLLVYAGVPAVVLLVVLARPLLSVAMGAEFFPAEKALALLAVSSGLGLAHAFYGQVLAARARTGLILMANASAFALTLALDLLLIPEYGITGAGAASLAGSLTLAVFVIVPASAEIGARVFPPRAAVFLLLSACFAVMGFGSRGAGAAVLSGVAAAYCVFWSAWLFFFEREEISRARFGLKAFLASRFGG